jgi:putative transposase
VSTVAKQLDSVVAAFHARPLKDQYRVLMFDGVVLARRTGAGAIRRPVLVAFGLRRDGRKEIIDFRLAQSESAAEWERFLGELIRRGLVGEGLEMICVDGGPGLLAALPTAYPGVPVQRCWAHKIPQCSRQGAGRRPASRQGRSARHHERHDGAAGAFGGAAFRQPLGGPLSPRRRLSAQRSRRAADLLALQISDRAQSRAHHHAIERRFREVRRRTRPMGVFSDRTSMDRILVAVFNHENQNQGVSTPLLLTQTF